MQTTIPATRRGAASLVLAGLLALALVACGGGGDGGSAQAGGAESSGLSPAASLGERIFNDPTLSASGRQSCASCHDAAHAHAQPNALAVQLGGPGLDVPGFRAVPSLRYLSTTPAFAFAKDGTPTGGFNHDGRAASLAIQSERPFLAPHEMANASKADMVERLKKAPYAAEFARVFGSDILSRPDDAFARAAFAIQQFEKESPAFRPFDSKYDLFLAGKVQLSAAEMRGLALFNSPSKGNCAACHPSARGADGSPPLFTDFTFDNLGVPRNPEIPATADPDYFDLGLCGPDRTDLADRSDLCGAFKVPTLRNVATRKAFFHNGRFKTLREAIGFYVRRDTNPAEWYPVGPDGTVQKFNDVPAAYRGNVNTTEAPYNRKAGDAPALTPEEIEDLIQFLNTLTDGYKP